MLNSPTMNRFVKTALLWLLALALPVQGWAAATQLSCAPVMHHAVMDASDGAHDMMNMDDHHAMHEMTAETEQTHASSSVPAPSTSKHGDMKCGACAACNVGMTALLSMHDWPLPSVDSTPAVAAPAISFLAHIPDGLKRPPRFFPV